MEIVVALLSGVFALVGVGLGSMQRQQEQRARVLERDEQQRREALARLEQLYESVLKLCLDVRAGAFPTKGAPHPVDGSTFRTIRAQLMLRGARSVEEAFLRYVEVSNRIAHTDPSEFLDAKTQRIEVDWSDANEALGKLQEAMQAHLAETRKALLDGSLLVTEENRLLPP